MRSNFRIKTLAALTAIVIISGLSGCLDGGGDSGSSASNGNSGSSSGGSTGGSTGTSGGLTAQTGQQSYLFFGNTNHQKLGSVTNIRIFDPAKPSVALTESDDIMAASTGRPQPTTALTGFAAADNSYTDLFMDKVYYVKGGTPKVASLKMTVTHNDTTHTDDVSKPTETAHSNATGLTNPAYTEIFYMGVKRFLIATNTNSKSVIVFPSADSTNSPEDFSNKTLISVFYPAWGQAASGIVVYDKNIKKFQKMTPSKAGCSACGEDATNATFTDFTGLTVASSYAFLGDIAGTTQSALIADGKLFILDRATMAITEQAVSPKNTSTTLADLLGTSGKGSYKFSGDSAYYVLKGSDNIANIYRVNAKTGELTQLTKDHGASGTIPSKFLAATDEWIFYGTDGLTLAVKKSADKASPTLLSENTKTHGQRYPFNFGIGADYLYQTYDVNTTTGKTTYHACVFSGAGVNTCKDNSFWGAVTAARKGKLNFTSDYRYTPYAYVRVDDTDDYGGGTLKVVDPAKPLDGGFEVGKAPAYNFNTFMHGYYYLNSMVDSNGYIVIYGKRDDNFVGDAFLLNLNKADSVVNLSKEGPPLSALINSGDLHCHGRYCSVCHNFAGGKIYGDKAGSVEATGYNVKFEFADGSSKLARLGKGKGENFSLLHSDIKGDFTPVVVSAADGSEIKRAAKQGHAGLSYANCDWCHARSGDTLRYGAPSVINTVK